jgi:hypothetical protein
MNAEHKAKVAQNAIRTGLFTSFDYRLPQEEPEYFATAERLQKELSPVGLLEEAFVAEILTATWRLRRCRVIEEQMSELDEKTQRSVDRARAHANLNLRRSINELRRLQTERAIRSEAAPSQASAARLPALAISGQVAKARKTEPAHDPNILLTQLAFADAALGMKTPSALFCNPPSDVRRDPRL